MPRRVFETFGEKKAAESLIIARGRIAAGEDNEVRLFRNNVGVFRRIKTGEYVPPSEIVRCGLAPGSSDLIGFRSIVITPDMVGKRVAVFCAPEAKAKYQYASKDQRAFIEMVRHFGGYAGVFRDNQSLLDITRGAYDADKI